MDFEDGILYRMAYGLAADLAEARTHNMQAGRHRSNAAAGGAFAAILAEVERRLTVAGQEGQETVREAVGDAWEGRRPRW